MQAESSVSVRNGRGARATRRNLVRGALLRSAQALLAEGRNPSVPEVADHAGIARATAYRQFSSAEQLLTEAALDAVAASIPAAAAPTPDAAAGGPEDAVEGLVRRVFAMVVENDPAFRTMLRLSLEDAGARRGGRRLDWTRQALEPWRDRFAPEVRDRLVDALALTLGIETWVALGNVAGLDRAAAEETAVWAARGLVARALAESAAPD